MKFSILIAGIALGIGLAASAVFLPTAFSKDNNTASREAMSDSIVNAPDSGLAIATFAGGCFWCVEAAFEKVPGVSEVISGYSGGEEVSPTYKQVASGRTGHTEAVQIHYDASVITYEGLLAALWRTANPTDNAGQYVDRGRQYRPEIFYHDETQKLAAIKAREVLDRSGRYKDPVVIGITPASEFYPAEDYHQDYYKKNPVRYKYYTRNSGRYQFVDSVWPEGRDINYADYRPDNTSGNNKSTTTITSESSMMKLPTDNTEAVEPFDPEKFVKPTDQELKAMLSPIEYRVTQKDGTERAFSNAMHDEKRAGLYVDIVSGEPLFSSSDKFDSGTGWPSFDRPITDGVVVEKADLSIFGARTEIRSKLADSHLGHVFNDGPASTGKRYCMNAAAMRFIPLEKMVEAGYGAYLERVAGQS